MKSPHSDSSQPKGNHAVTGSGTITLYHGSKAGIQGTITPTSRVHCDFGRGFYMGTDKSQPLTLICNYPKAKIYTLCVDLSSLKLFDIAVGLDRFFNGEITDLALINSLSALKLGRQYVALTQRACQNITIIDVQEISEHDRATIKMESDANRKKGISLADEICRKYRREGLYFDEILKTGK